jgi:tetratricopeptide (TPR) repeat protein
VFDIRLQTGHLRVAGFIFIALVSGCASTPQTDRLLQAIPSTLQQPTELNHVVFFPQEAYQCGPAALATLLHEHDRRIQPEQLTDEVFIPDLKGSLQPELLAATRRHGYIPYVLRPELAELLTEVQHGRPVLILQNLGLSWYPKWHYAVAVGYDLQQPGLVLRSGLEARHEVGLHTFERTWARGKHWAMVALKPGELPAQPEEWRYVQAIVGLEKLPRWDELHLAYATGIKQWPANLELRMGLGNLYFLRGDKQAALQEYLGILALAPEYAPALNNLAQVYTDLGQHQQGLIYAERAVQAGGVHSDVYLSTLNEIRARLAPTPEE